MRIRGTSTKELEAAGEETDGLVTSTSKLYSKVKSLTAVGGKEGISILGDDGKYLSTYQILVKIADRWDEITQVGNDSALLELLAGKTRGSVVAALLQQPDVLKNAYQDAMDAEGSALKENEKYLDSIQGRIGLFTNAVQTMWQNTLDSGVVKWFINLGTSIIKVVDSLGLIPSILSTIGLYKIVPLILKLVTHTNTFGVALTTILKPLVQLKGSGQTLAQIFSQTAAGAMNAAGGVSTFGAYLKAAGTTLKAFVSTPLGWFTIAAIAIGAVVGVVNLLTTSTKEIEEELDNLNSEINSIKGEIDSLNSELETTQSRIAELTAMGSLSFTEEEELRNLKLQNAELERQIRLQEEMLKFKQEEQKNTAKELGLPEDTAWEEIEQVRLNRDDLRLSYANKLGLSENPTWTEIDLAVNAELIRRERIKALNLPKDYTLEQVNQVESKMIKAKMITELGLPEDATWEQIDQANYEASMIEIENRNSGMHR